MTSRPLFLAFLLSPLLLASTPDPLAQPAKEEPSSQEVAPLPSPPLSVVIASADASLQQEIERALQALLLGDLSAARHEFGAALQRDAKHPLALCGMLMCVTDPQEFDKHASALKQLDESYVPTPQEGRYLEGLYMLISQQDGKAQQHFVDLASRYRRDLLSRLWAALLIQDGYSELRLPNEGQIRALKLLDEILEQPSSSKHGLLYYMRAYLEADAPSPSDRSLDYAQQAVKLLPQEPMPRLLAAHLLTRRMKLYPEQAETLREEAARLLSEAEQLHLSRHQDASKPEAFYRDDLHSFFWLRLRLYRISLLLENQRAYAFRLYVETSRLMSHALDTPLTKQEQQRSTPHPAGRDLILWEWSLLPLRELMLSDRNFSEREIDALTRKSLDYKICRDHPTHRRIVSCIKQTLLARYSFKDSQLKLAQKRLAEAQLEYDTLVHTRDLDSQLRSNPLFARALDTCAIAICLAQIEIYAQTADIWRDKLESLDLRASMLMPPIQVQ